MTTTELGLEVLVETHNLAELEVVIDLVLRLLGLITATWPPLRWRQTSVDFPALLRKVTITFLNQPFSQGRMERVAPYFNGILVGTALMQVEDVAQRIKELQIDKG